MRRRVARLDPLRFQLPQRRAVLRWGLVAALLALAVGALYAGPATTSCPPPSTSVTAVATPPTPAPAPAESDLGGDVGDPPVRAVPAGMVGVTIRLAEPALVAVLRPGAHIDVGANAGAGIAVVDAVVLAAVPGSAFDEPGAAALVIAIPQASAAQVTNVATGTAFRVLVRST
jgi:hypothetical protein